MRREIESEMRRLRGKEWNDYVKRDEKCERTSADIIVNLGEKGGVGNVVPVSNESRGKKKKRKKVSPGMGCSHCPWLLCVYGVCKDLDHCHWPACVHPCLRLGGPLTLLDGAPHTTQTNGPLTQAHKGTLILLLHLFPFFLHIYVTFIYGSLVSILFILPPFHFFISHNCLMEGGKKVQSTLWRENGFGWPQCVLCN